jgi:YVTN family beta-propeller protein
VTFNGSPVPAASFLPFGACAGGRMQSQTATVAVTLPNGTIGGGPTSLNRGQQGTYSGSGTGDGLAWTFDGGAAQGTGSPIQRTFAAGGNFVVRLRATKTQGLAASGLNGGGLVGAQRSFLAADATPDTRQLAVTMPADVDFTNFESGHTHPLALKSDGSQLYAVNTPENRLGIFDVDGAGNLAFVDDVPVGFDPVSVATRPGTNEAWVVNHLSDTVTIVDTANRRVLGTIVVGDEPTDVAFASGRAFVTLAGNQDRLKVYNAATRALVTTLDLFGDDPRALAVNAAGTEVYVVVLESGNRTTTLFHSLVTAGGGPPAPSPARNPALGPAPDVGLIVKFNGTTWRDETGTSGTNWSPFVNFTLPDNDVFVIDADAPTPSLIRTVSGVGTILFDVAFNPATQRLWVTNTDARNLVRFESNLRGHLVDTRISVVDPSAGTVVGSTNLNPHINFAVTPGPAGEIAQSLAHPGQGVFNAAGSQYWVAAFGSRKVGVLNAAGTVTARIDVGGGPSGLALNESDNRLYAMNRFDNTISTVDTVANTQVAVTGVAGAGAFDPSPNIVKVGRKFLYDGASSSGHGDAACATCHIFGNFDNIAWDLGAPEGNFTPYSSTPWVQFGPLLGPSTSGFDPMKGPMTTQTLRGLKNTSPFHWRGDRQNFQHFNGAFINLMGRDAQISTADMDAFTAFIETVQFPPNPYRNLNDTMPASILVPQQTGGGVMVAANPNTGATDFSGAPQPLDAGFFQCAQCHALPTGTNRLLFNGNAEGESQDFKIPHLRNMYEKIGFDVIRPGLQSGNANNIALPVQRRGFGFLHDGSVSMTEFQAAPVFVSSDQQERNEFAFMLAFPSGNVPAVGWQITVDASNKASGSITTAITQLIAQAETTRADMVVKGTIGGVAKGWMYDTVTDLLVPDAVTETAIGESALRASVAGNDILVYTGVPNGAATRLGIDRDRDTWLDRTETAFGYDPANPNSNPWQD